VTLALLAAALVSAQPITSNANTCDIGVTPAATLLLPYFEVDTAAPVGKGATTLFTITNTSRFPQIVHVTLWTDWAFPVVGFNILLTGYDVHGINLYDVIKYGLLTPSSAAAGAVPFNGASNPNFAPGELSVEATCAGLRTVLPLDLIPAVRSALTTGAGYANGGVSCPGPVGANHGVIAKGYATVDVVSYCSSLLPTDSGGAYFQGTSAPLLFDNVLIGDYQQIGPPPSGSGVSATIDARGSPMVPIRAIPEGGLSGAGGGQVVRTNLPFTFYDRYTPAGARAADRRQPLPSMWALRYIEGGSGNWTTDFKIWREGVTAGLPTCGSNGTVQDNQGIIIANVVRLDEHENAMGYSYNICSACRLIPPNLPATSRTSSASGPFPAMNSNDIGGWFFLNLGSRSQHDNGQTICDRALSAQRAGFTEGFDVYPCTTGAAAPGTGGSRSTSQNWVVVSMFGVYGTSRLAVDFDGAWLGNGCTPSERWGGTVAPANQRSGPLVCPDNLPRSKCGIGALPPAVNP
jgi:hypothetical protein